MSFFRSIPILLFVGFAAAACARPEEKPAVSSNNSDRQSVQTPANSMNSNVPGDAPSASNEAVLNDPIGNNGRSKMDDMRKRAANANVPKPDREAALKQSERPAPENSTFEVALTDTVMERRTFLNNPELLKVERETNGEKKTVRIFLKSGKVIELPGDSIQFLATATTASILQAAGLVTRVEGTKKPNVKPSGN